MRTHFFDVTGVNRSAGKEIYRQGNPLRPREKRRAGAAAGKTMGRRV